MRSALRLVWTLDLRHLASHRMRLALSAVGIAAGVALAVSVAALGASIDASLRGIADAAASRANIEVRPETGVGLPEETYLRVRQIEGVRAAGATVESYVKLRHGEAEARTLLLGIDEGVMALAPRAVDPASFEAADPFGLMLPEAVARELGVAAGDGIDIATPTGWRQVAVGAVLSEEMTGRSRAAVGLIGVVQDLLDKTGRIDAIYLEADDPDTVLPLVAGAVEGVGRAGPVALRQDDLRDMLASTTIALNVAALVALFVGAFLVYNTMAMAAVERVGEAALLRAVGARRRQVFSLFLAEGGALGVVGTALGLTGGVALARILLIRRGSAIEEIFPIDITRLVVDPLDLALAGVAGVLAAVAAAYLPARRVARSDPAPALGPAGTLEDPTRGPRRATSTVGVLLGAAGVGIVLYELADQSQIGNVAMVGLTLLLGGVSLLVPTIIPAVAGPVVGRLARGRSPGIVRLAAGEILRAPGRTAFTAGAVLLALSLIVGFSITMASFRHTFQTGMDRILRADLFVRSPTWRPFGSDVPLDAGLVDEIRRVDGVHTAYAFKITTGRMDDQLVVLQALDLVRYSQLPDHDPEWRREAMALARSMRQRDAVAISSSFGTRMGVDVGDTIRLSTPSGPRRFRVAGIFPDPSAVNPTLVFDFTTYARTWRTNAADSFGIGVRPGHDPAEVRAALGERFGPDFGVVVDTRQGFVDRVNSFVGSIQGLIGSVQLVAVIVAGLGLANTLLISTLERRRDLGVLRAVGMLRRQMRRMVTVEAVLVGGIGVVLAWGLGTVLGLFMFNVMRSNTGIDMQLAVPWTAYAVPALLGVGGAALAALYPAHRAARVDVVSALQYE